MRGGRSDLDGTRTGKGTGSRTVLVLLVLLIGASVALELWFAWRGLHPGRYWDERFSFQNVRALLGTGWIRPANGYYQALSYLPQTALLALSEALHRWTGVEALAVFDAGRHFSPTAFLVARTLQVLHGAGALFVTFLVGRRLFSPAVGLLAAFLLAVTPWHVQAASMFKPDILLMLTVMLTFWWSLRAVEEPTARRYAVAGCGVALAVSSKLTGGLAVLPLLVAAARSEGGWGVRTRRLAAAGAAGAALFVALNPYFPMYVEFFGRNIDHYTRRAASYGGTRLEVLGREAELLTSWAVHGRVVGLIAFGAALALVLRLVVGGRRRGDSGHRAGPGTVTGGWMLLAFPVGYSLAYAALTPHFKDNNFLPVIPFTALLAAWGLVRLGRLAADRWPALERPWIAAAAGLLLVAALAPAPFRYVYAEIVPTTADEARKFLQGRFAGAGGASVRLVFTEPGLPDVRDSLVVGSSWQGRVAVVAVERVADVPGGRLDRADGAIFPASHLEGEESDGYLRRIARVDRAAVRRIEPAPFAVRGAERVAIAHPWRSLGPPVPWAETVRPPAGGSRRIPPPPGVDGADAVSILVAEESGWGAPRVDLAPRSGSPEAPRPVPLWRVAGSWNPALYLSERLSVDALRGGVRLRWDSPAGSTGPGDDLHGTEVSKGPGPVQVQLLGWKAPDTAPRHEAPR